MHGDKNNPDEAILIKDDYEKYYREHAQFITALSGDLISKTFLFIGFSFADPNIDYILSRIRIDYGENKRQHYALIRKIKENEYENRADYLELCKTSTASSQNVGKRNSYFYAMTE